MIKASINNVGLLTMSQKKRVSLESSTVMYIYLVSDGVFETHGQIWDTGYPT